MEDKKQKFSLKKYTEKASLIKTGAQAAGGLGGLITASVVNKKLNPTQGVLVPAAAFVVGLLGVHHFNVNPPKEKDTLMRVVQGAAVGTAIFGGLKTAEYGLAKLSKAGTSGMGFLPAGTVDKIRSLIPTINGMGEANPSGYYNDPMASMMGINNSDYYLPSYNAVPVNGMVEGEFQVAEVL